MSYDFKADGGYLSSYPNPFKIENSFLIAAAIVFFAGGVVSLITAKNLITAEEIKVGLAACMVSLYLFALGVRLMVRGLAQLRFWMGQHYPLNLSEAPDDANAGVGLGSSNLQDMLRQQAIVFPEPKGPLNGILYSLVRKLIVAPATLQAAAQIHFATLVNSIVILASLAFSWALYDGTKFEGFMSWLYLPLSGLSLLQIIKNRMQSDAPPAHDAVMLQAALIAIVAVLGPVVVPLLAMKAPIITSIPPMWQVSLCALLGAIGTSALFLSSAAQQIDAAEQTGVACEMKMISMNCHPVQLWSEIDRDLQRNWTHEIPNRKYISILPRTSDSERGEFTGSAMEETQPEPKDRMVFSTFKEAMSLSHGRYLIAMSAFGLLLSMLTVMAAIHLVGTFSEMETVYRTRSCLIIFALGTAAMGAISGGHLLWSRMHFKSRLTWIELLGSYQTAKMDVGNTFRGQFKSSSTLTRIENATIRIWSADIETVSFGKDGARAVIGMKPASEMATSMTEKLIKFALDQTSVTGPTSAKDYEKMQAISQFGQSLQRGLAGPSTPGQLLPTSTSS